jgi:capsid assembly protease
MAIYRAPGTAVAAHLYAEFQGKPVAILPERIHFIGDTLKILARDGQGARQIAAAGNRRSGSQYGRHGIGIISVGGVLLQRASDFEEAIGFVGTERIGRQLDLMVSDSTIDSVILHFDSPGGSVFGLAELAAKIRAARERKKIYGIADSLAASAAYWLLSQCTEVSVTPGGLVGSIGVITMHLDYSKQLAAEGIKTTLIHAGKYKAEGSPYEPLDQAARGEMQSKVDAYHDAFVTDVARGRRVSQAKVRSDFGQGRLEIDGAAVTAGLADKVQTMQQLVSRLSGSGADNVGRGVGASVPVGFGSGYSSGGRITGEAARLRVLQIERECGL